MTQHVTSPPTPRRLGLTPSPRASCAGLGRASVGVGDTDRASLQDPRPGGRRRDEGPWDHPQGSVLCLGHPEATCDAGTPDHGYALWCEVCPPGGHT